MRFLVFFWQNFERKKLAKSCFLTIQKIINRGLKAFFCYKQVTRLGVKQSVYPPATASQVSREVANLTEIKNTLNPAYGVKEFVCLTVCLSACYQIRSQLSMLIGTKTSIRKSLPTHRQETSCLFTTASNIFNHMQK